MEQVRPIFSSQDALVSYAQQQLERAFIKVIGQQKSKKSRIKTLEELSPEVQTLLTATAPLAGSVPEWDLNGDVAKNEALKEKYGN